MSVDINKSIPAYSNENDLWNDDSIKMRKQTVTIRHWRVKEEWAMNVVSFDQFVWFGSFL